MRLSSIVQWGATTIRSSNTEGREREFWCLGFLDFFFDILRYEWIQRGGFSMAGEFFFWER